MGREDDENLARLHALYETDKDPLKKDLLNSLGPDVPLEDKFKVLKAMQKELEILRRQANNAEIETKKLFASIRPIDAHERAVAETASEAADPLKHVSASIAAIEITLDEAAVDATDNDASSSIMLNETIVENYRKMEQATAQLKTAAEKLSPEGPAAAPGNEDRKSKDDLSDFIEFYKKDLKETGKMLASLVPSMETMLNVTKGCFSAMLFLADLTIRVFKGITDLLVNAFKWILNQGADLIDKKPANNNEQPEKKPPVYSHAANLMKGLASVLNMAQKCFSVIAGCAESIIGCTRELVDEQRSTASPRQPR